MADGGDPGFTLDDMPVAAVTLRGRCVVAANDLALALLDDDGRDPIGADLDELVTRRLRRGHHIRVVDRAEGRHGLAVLHDETDERRLSAVIDAVADSTLLIDQDGLVAWQSERLSTRIPGAGAGLGLNPVERIHPEDLPYTLESLGKGLSDPTYSTRYTVRSRSPEDDDVWEVIEITGASRIEDPDLRGIVVQVRNLGEGEVQPSIGEAEGRFQSLADAAPIGIVVVDARGRTVFRNSMARALLRQEHDLHSGRSWHEAAPAGHRSELEAMVAAALDGHTRHVTALFEPDAGERVWLRVNVVPQRGGEAADVRRSVVGAIVTLEDVTAEVEAREETSRLTHMLDATADYVAVWRPSGEILYVNAATRAALSALRGSSGRARLSDLIDDEPRQQFAADALAVLETSDTWRGELPLNVAPDRTIPVSAIGVVRRDERGEIEWFAMLARDISDLKDAEERLRQLATRDALTGLANRELFSDRLEQAAARQRRHAAGLAVLFCDLDGFKLVNDAHGHAVGDQVLLATADRLRSVTRDADTVARVGGDEFVIVCEGELDDRELAELADRIIGAVNEPVSTTTGSSVRVGISLGIAEVGAGERQVDPDRLLIAADTAMYRAKARGGNGYRIVRYGAVEGSQG